MTACLRSFIFNSYTYIRVRTLTHLLTHTHSLTHSLTYLLTHTHTHTHSHTHTHTHSHTLTRTHTPSLLLSLTLTHVFSIVSLKGCGDLKFSQKRPSFGEIRGHHRILLLILILETSWKGFFGVVCLLFFFLTKSVFWFLKIIPKINGFHAKWAPEVSLRPFLHRLRVFWPQHMLSTHI